MQIWFMKNLVKHDFIWNSNPHNWSLYNCATICINYWLQLGKVEFSESYKYLRSERSWTTLFPGPSTGIIILVSCSNLLHPSSEMARCKVSYWDTIMAKEWVWSQSRRDRTAVLSVNINFRIFFIYFPLPTLPVFLLNLIIATPHNFCKLSTNKCLISQGQGRSYNLLHLVACYPLWSYEGLVHHHTQPHLGEVGQVWQGVDSCQA